MLSCCLCRTRSFPRRKRRSLRLRNTRAASWKRCWKSVMRLHILETDHPTDAPIGKELPLDGHPSGWVWQRQEALVVSDTHEETRFPEYMTVLREKGVRAFALVPLTTAQRRVGAMGFGRMVPDAVMELSFM